MAKCKKYEWFAIVKDGDIRKDSQGLGMIAKTKKALLDAYVCSDEISNAQEIVKIEITTSGRKESIKWI